MLRVLHPADIVQEKVSSDCALIYQLGSANIAAKRSFFPLNIVGYTIVSVTNITLKFVLILIM